MTMQLRCPQKRSLQLPADKFRQLQRLEIRDFTLQLPGDAGGNVDQQLSSHELSVSDNHAEGVFPSLQLLKLSCVKVVSTSSLLQLTHAPQLTSLTVERIDVAGLQFAKGGTRACKNTAAAVRQVAAALPAVLQRLPRLSVCELPGMPLSDAAVQQLLAMQGGAAGGQPVTSSAHADM